MTAPPRAPTVRSGGRARPRRRARRSPPGASASMSALVILPGGLRAHGRHLVMPAESGRGARLTPVMEHGRLDGGTFLMGTGRRTGIAADGEGPSTRSRCARSRLDADGGHERALPGVRRSAHRSRHGRRALRLVVRVRRAAPGRLPRHSGRRAGAVVAPGVRGGLGPPGRSALEPRGPRRPPGRPRLLGRRAGLLRLGRRRVSRPKRSGSTRRVAALVQQRFPWGDDLEPAASTA